jgi:hypothetical protein
VSHYDFQTLSPLDFEELVRDLLQTEFGLLFESFGPGRDPGIDGLRLQPAMLLQPHGWRGGSLPGFTEPRRAAPPRSCSSHFPDG